MEFWQFAALVRVPAVGIVLYYSRRGMGRKTRALTLFLQFFIAFLWTAACAVAVGEFDFSRESQLVLGIGAFNGVAVYCMWNANALSMSKNGFFTAFDDIGAMILTMIVVPGTVAAIDQSTMAGIIICVGATLALAFNNWRKRRSRDPGAIPMKFYAFAISYTILWGIAIFSIGISALAHMGPWRFTSMWYAGASLVGLLVFMLDSFGIIPNRPQNRDSMPVVLRESAYLGFAVSFALVFQFMAFEGKSLAILQPIFLITDVVMAAVIAIRFYDEGKQYDRFDVATMLVGIIGSFLIFWP